MIAKLLSLFGILLLCGCQSEKPAALEKITIACAVPPYTALVDIALAKGLFRQAGLEVTPHFHSTGKESLDEVLRGEADFATVAETPFMFAVMNGSKIAIIATIQGSNRTDAILARRDKGISTPQDLKGKRIAVPLGTTADYFLDAFLAVNSMTKKDVVVVDLKPEQMPLALVKGDVDAASTWAPVLEQTQRELGDEAVTFYEEDIYTQTFNLVASSEQVRTYPGRIRKLLSALVEAGKFAAQQPGDAQKSIADYRKFDAQVLSSIWGDHSLEVSLNQALLLALEDESLWAIRNEQTSAMKIPNYLDFLYLDGLQAVKPEAVRIVR